MLTHYNHIVPPCPLHYIKKFEIVEQVRSSMASIIDDNITNRKVSFLMENIIGLFLVPTPLGLNYQYIMKLWRFSPLNDQ